MAKKVYEGLRVRKLADKTDGERLVRFHPITGDRVLIKPESLDQDGFDYESMTPDPWPFAGLAIDGDPPKHTRVPTSFAVRGQAEDWLELEGIRMVHRPGGPRENPWLETHTFTHADAVVLKTVDGDVRYRVVGQPDKWPDEKDGDLGFGGEVRWFYELELEG